MGYIQLHILSRSWSTSEPSRGNQRVTERLTSGEPRKDSRAKQLRLSRTGSNCSSTGPSHSSPAACCHSLSGQYRETGLRSSTQSPLDEKQQKENRNLSKLCAMWPVSCLWWRRISPNPGVAHDQAQRKYTKLLLPAPTWNPQSNPTSEGFCVCVREMGLTILSRLASDSQITGIYRQYPADL